MVPIVALKTESGQRRGAEGREEPQKTVRPIALAPVPHGSWDCDWVMGKDSKEWCFDLEGHP